LSLGLAVLIGYANEAISNQLVKHRRATRIGLVRYLPSILVLALIVMAGLPWWSGDASGNPTQGPATKLNLYQMPAGYTTWNNAVDADSQHLVLYLPYLSGAVGNLQINNTAYFSGSYEGVTSGIFYGVNNLPYVSISNTSLIMSGLFNGSSQVAEKWASSSIKYVVVYTNLVAPYRMSDLLGNLSVQSGLVKVASLPGVVVYEDEYAKPLVYADSANVTTQILSQDPTSYTVQAKCSSPFLLTLDQAYSNGWQASVNGTAVPTSDHVSVNNSLGVAVNGWHIGECGTLGIDIYFKPQTAYIASLLFSIGTFFALVVCLVVIEVRDASARRSRKAAQSVVSKEKTLSTS
jgi:hypothetical protein